MDDNYYFDNILIASDPVAAEEARQTYWQPKKAVEVSRRHYPKPPPIYRKIAVFQHLGGNFYWRTSLPS